MNILKANSFRHMTTPTAITTTTSHQDLNSLFKLNNERLTSTPIGQMQNELEFNEMQAPKVQQPIGGLSSNLNSLNNLNSNLNGNLNPAILNQNLSPNLGQSLKPNTNLNANLNLADHQLSNSSQPVQLNSTFPLTSNLSTQNATLVL